MIKIPETEFLAVVTDDTKNNVYVFSYQTCKSCSKFPCYDCHSTWLLFIFFNIIIFFSLTCSGTEETDCLSCDNAL